MADDNKWVGAERHEHKDPARFYELGGADFDLIVRALKGHRIIARGYVLNPNTVGKAERCEFHERNFKFWTGELERVESLLDKLGEK